MCFATGQLFRLRRKDLQCRLFVTVEGLAVYKVILTGLDLGLNGTANILADRLDRFYRTGTGRMQGVK